MNKTIQPRIGIKLSSTHHPVRPISCKRRMVTDKLGIKIMSVNIVLKRPMSVAISKPNTISMIDKTTEIILVNKINIQYSLRRDLLLKSKLFLKTSKNSFKIPSPKI